MNRTSNLFGSIILILFSLSALFSQEDIQVKIDSLDSFLKENPSSIFINYDIAELYEEIDSAVALGYVRKGLESALKKNNAFGIGKGHFLLGDFYDGYGNHTKAEYHLKTADTVLSEVIKKDSSEEYLKLWVRANFNIGVVRSMQGINEDVYYINKISKVAEKIGYFEILAKANTNIGIGFFNQGQHKKAYEYFKLGAPQHLKSNDFQSYITNRLLFSSCLLQMDSLSRAKMELDNVKPVLDSLPKKDKQQLYHTILAEYFIGTEAYDKAIINLKKAERFLNQNPIQSNKLPLYMTFMNVYRAKKDYRKGLEYAQKCRELALQYQNKIIEAEIYKELSYYQHQLGRDGEALESLASYVAISDTINTSELEKEINRLESQYQSEKKERQIFQLKSENNETELELAKKQSENYFLISISLGLFILASLTFFGYRNFKKQDQLKSAEINQLKYEQESKVYSAMLEGQENERQRLAIDLHDGLAGRLSATRIKLEKLAKKSNGQTAELEFKQAAKNIDDSLSELRGIAMNLMPETLFRYGLKNAIEDYCSSISSGIDDIKFIIQFYDDDRELSNSKSLTIYRIMQELINNAVKHSKAKEVLVQYLIEDDKIHITVEDNGNGFSPKESVTSGGMGLNNLRTRVAYLNGEIDFDSIPNEGTNVNIVIEV
ncbi:tetratricopeptide repeat-containing sensor histidine kinase [Croceivirga thetidis]|uniref:tetratricopeptide repeat-containing sensor histidine kinase n=1 Tax=Croceivirga thetidis TaxID=2721623 RepID=UPI001B2FE958|nr:sensor histidine kinase [Croceivirga thetidis]